MSDDAKPSKNRRGPWVGLLCLGVLALLCGVVGAVIFIATGATQWSSLAGVTGCVLGGASCTFVARYKLREVDEMS
jgi:hypothetical protein